MPICEGLRKHMNALMHGSLCWADAVEHCDILSPAGMLSRLWCPQTCGCDNALSQLHYSSVNFGCAHSCQLKAERHITERPCTDMQPDSPEFAAFDRHNWTSGLGCKAVLVDYEFYCESSSKTAPKSFKNFCPVSCRLALSGQLSEQEVASHVLRGLCVHILTPTWILACFVQVQGW